MEFISVPAHISTIYPSLFIETKKREKNEHALFCPLQVVRKYYGYRIFNNDSYVVLTA
jgi:hypothetical protein